MGIETSSNERPGFAQPKPPAEAPSSSRGAANPAESSAGRSASTGTKTPVLALTLWLPRRVWNAKAMIPTLRVAAGRDMLSFVALAAGQSVTLGRDADCDLAIDDASVSRRHTMVSCDERGVVTLEDLGSTNGTVVNGLPVIRAILKSGDKVELGVISLRFDLLGMDELAHLDRVREKLRASGSDPLTGLKTRATFDDEIPLLISESESVGAPICAIFVDLDRFKDINDRFGHPVGDDVLRETARILMLCLRDSDVCIRFGGEEFLIILPGCDSESSQLIASRMRVALAGHDWPTLAPNLAVTASFGVAAHLPGETQARWISRADQALYAAKNGGRNKVVAM